MSLMSDSQITSIIVQMDYIIHNKLKKWIKYLKLL